jgi:hypothetical protein
MSLERASAGGGPQIRHGVVSKILRGADENHYKVGLQPAIEFIEENGGGSALRGCGGNLLPFWRLLR